MTGWHTQPEPPPTAAKKFEIAVRCLADSLNYGSDNSPFLGSGIDYAQSRPYLPGDPVKSIDWRVTARTGRVHVKTYEAPKRMPVWLLLDTSASMCVTSQARSKYAIALEIATAVGLAAQERLSPVGLLGLGQRELRLQPTLSRTRLMQTAHELRRYRVDESTRFFERIRTLAPMLENRSMILILSDFHDPDFGEGLKRIAGEHDVASVYLSDPAEFATQGHAVMRMREAETGTVFSAYAHRERIDRKEVCRTMARAHVDCLPLTIDKPIVPPLRYFLAKRGIIGRSVR